MSSPAGRAPRPAFADGELAAGTTAHYEDPAYYQRTYVRRTADVDFYVARAEASGGAVLEYGCGNGRITIPMARAGARVVGIDLSEPMLADLRARLATEPRAVQARVTVRHGDMREARLRERFALVACPFNAFLHLYEREDVERFLARVRAHLAPGGAFVFDVSIPDAEELARPAHKLHRTRPFVYPGVGRVRYGERFDYDKLRQVLFVSMEFEPEGDEPPFVTPLAHRQFYPRELEALLHYNGFAIHETLGDFAGEPDGDTLGLALVCKLRKGWRG